MDLMVPEHLKWPTAEQFSLAVARPAGEAISQADHEWLEEVLGRPLHQVLGVAVRDQRDRPRVIINDPVKWAGARIEPFPTLYWLTCPRLCLALSQLERQGVITEIQEKIAHDAELNHELASDHQRYIRKRWQWISPDDRQHIMQQGLYENYLTRGIGGTSNFTAVKCLHMHYAHHLVDGNTIGRVLEQGYGIIP